MGLVKNRFIIIILAFLSGWQQADAQEMIIDRVIAVVGKSMILESDVEGQYAQYRMQGDIRGSASETKCWILENMLLEKLLLNQAELDSVVVTDSEVEQKMDERMRFFIAQFGSQERLEEFYQKSIIEIKDEFRELVRNQLKEEQVQQSITKNVYVTPSEVKEFYRSMPKDSIPLINAQVEIAQVIKIPPVSMEQKVGIKEKLRDLRRRILAGESFSTLAILYSEDPGSASKGGELGFYGRGELFPEFEAVAFKLKEGEVSEIVETKAGFHIIQMIERKGEYINVRHILLMAKPSPEDIADAQVLLDSISGAIRNGEISFEDAVKQFSDDPGKSNGGLMINPYTGTTKYEMDQLEPQVSFAIDRLQIGEVSTTVMMKTEEGQDAFRIMTIKSRTEPHRANLKEDYSRLQDMALVAKQQKKLSDWVDKNIRNAYVMINPDYRACSYHHQWAPDDLQE